MTEEEQIEEELRLKKVIETNMHAISKSMSRLSDCFDRCVYFDVGADDARLACEDIINAARKLSANFRDLEKVQLLKED